MIKILIVEDDADLSNIIKLHLNHAGYTPITAYNAEQAFKLLDDELFDLILLDIVLPDLSGIELCKAVRSKTSCPIIFTSCLEDTQTVIKALQCGGDDYMVKPLNYGELIARIQANLRRQHKIVSVSSSNIIHYHNFVLDTDRHSVLRNEEEISLSSIEYNLLLYFCDHPNTLISYDELYEHIWKTDSAGDTRTVMVHISNLRKKIDPNHLGSIQTVRGAGYIFNDSPLFYGGAK